MSPALSVTTAAGGSDMGITYDLNNAFAPIQIFAAPGNITSFTIASDSSNTSPGASSVRQIAFAPSQNFFYWPVVQLNWDNTLFTISNLVSIDTGASSSSLTPLTSGTGANQFYTTSPSTTSLNIYHNAPLFTSQTVKYNFTTQNPSSATSQSINFSLKIFHRYNLNLTDVSSTSPVTVTAANGVIFLWLLQHQLLSNPYQLGNRLLDLPIHKSTLESFPIICHPKYKSNFPSCSLGIWSKRHTTHLELPSKRHHLHGGY
jgi:hypothetical protein